MQKHTPETKKTTNNCSYKNHLDLIYLLFNYNLNIENSLGIFTIGPNQLDFRIKFNSL